jgi:hypothetical protein
MIATKEPADAAKDLTLALLPSLVFPPNASNEQRATELGKVYAVLLDHVAMAGRKDRG